MSRQERIYKIKYQKINQQYGRLEQEEVWANQQITIGSTTTP